MRNHRILIIPDVHTQIRRAEWALANIEHDRVVWLGDWFDDFGDSVESNRLTALWLRNRMDTTQDVFLLGNHDAPYLWPEVRGLLCSGHTREKRTVINEVLPRTYRKRFSLFFLEDERGFLLSHAGLHPSFGLTKEQQLRTEVWECLDHLENGLMHPLVGAGVIRGGSQPYGGITWLDWREIEPIGWKQIVGHTRGVEPRCSGDNWCIDTHLRHCAVLEDEVTIHEIRDGWNEGI